MQKKKRVVILGGGLGSLAAAFALTSPEIQEPYEVTVYQLGWRLGGKGASGRNAAAGQRIEEHGLHLWLGWYQNAFRLIRDCFQEWKPTDGCPFALWSDAFQPQDHITLMEHAEGQWRPWKIDCPTNPELPGDDDSTIDSLWDYIVMLISLMLRRHEAVSDAASAGDQPAGLGFGARVRGWGRRLSRSFHWRHLGLRCALVLIAAGAKGPWQRSALLGAVTKATTRRFRRHLRKSAKAAPDSGDELRRFLMLADLACTVVVGLLEDRVYSPADLYRLDAVDFRDWLNGHGALEMASESALVQALYDLGFSYAGGDPARPTVAAGAMLQTVLRTALGYKGSVLWKMQAGMGDTVFTPLYEVLKARGVRFKFFHKVTQLEVSDDSSSVARVHLAVQATPKVEEYDPLISVNGLRCWPSEPKYEQLHEGEQLRQEGINLESWWTPWKDVDHVTLEAGGHFDYLVLGISLGSLPFISQSLIEAKPAWREMVEQIPTVQTRAFQLWLKPNVRGLGWTGPHTVLSAYDPWAARSEKDTGDPPFSTWGDMSHLVPRESWPQDEVPGSIAYFCGTMLTPKTIPSATEQTFPGRAEDSVREQAQQWLNRRAARVWPGGVHGSGDFKHGLLIHPPGGSEDQRFLGQYFRANIDPSERYVQTPPGSTRYRLEPGRSGFSNLVLAGDWVWTGLNGGCVEAAVMGGLLAAQAICGFPKTIPGFIPKPSEPSQG